jgi:hypothetical protein
MCYEAISCAEAISRIVTSNGGFEPTAYQVEVLVAIYSQGEVDATILYLHREGKL